MADVFTEQSHESWFSRIGNSFKSLIFGFLLFVISFPLLFWNEGRAVTTSRSLNEGEQATVSVASETVDPANEGKLIHVSGMAETEEVLRDEQFGIEANAIRLNRIAEMFQWDEDKKTESKKNLGGSKTKTTTYSYDKEWSSSLISSSGFKKREGHENPTSMPITGQTKTAEKVNVGAFMLSSDLVSAISGQQSIAVSEANIPEEFKDRMKLSGENQLYLGTNPAAPAIGDVRVRFQATPASEVSILAQQTGNSFQPYQTHAGDALSRLEAGKLSAAQMFEHARSEANMFTWMIRALGAGMMFGGLVMLMSPLAVLGDVIPIIGSIIAGGSWIVAGLITLILAPMTIAIAWMFYRPLVALPLLAVSGAALFFLISRRKSNALPEVMTLDEGDVVT